MSKKKSEHYVNNKELLEALIVYRSKVEEDFVSRSTVENLLRKIDLKIGKENHRLQITWVSVS